jgi:DNA-binding protein H-NS
MGKRVAIFSRYEDDRRDTAMPTLSEMFATRGADAGQQRRPVHGEAREHLIVWLRERMERAGITLEALERELMADARAALAVRYRDAYGNTWDGAGAMPTWLTRAVAAGQSVEHFSCPADAR